MAIMTTIVNLTPHSINAKGANGTLREFEPSGEVARVATSPTVAGEVEGIALHRVEFGEVIGLPEPAADTIFIVSALVRGAVPHRTDVVSPGSLLRDEAGQPVGCDGFAVN